jgi:hypothetical protein
MIKELEKEFIGTGEAKGLKFTQIESLQHSYLYEVVNGDKIYYEVFKRVNSPICIDFEKRIYSETDFKETYPKSSQFGITAWTIKNKEDAIRKMVEINNSEIEKLKEGES